MQPDDDLLQVSVQNSVLRNCSPATREALFQHGKIATYEPGEKVWGEGEPAKSVLFPLKGKLQLSKTASNGRRQVFCYMQPGGCSDVCLFLIGEHSLADIYAVEPSQALVVASQALADLSTTDPFLGREAWQTVTNCLGHFVAMVENLSFHKVSERVALALLDATAHNGSTVRRTQAELAAEVGTTREVVARCLADFQDVGAIRLGRGRIVVLDREQLSAAA